MSGLTNHWRHRRFPQLTVMLVATALLTAAGSTASADNGTSPKAPNTSEVTEAARHAALTSSHSSTAAAFGLFAIDAQGKLYSYAPDQTRILAPRELLATDYGDARTASSADDDGDGVADNTWIWTIDGGMSSSYGYVGGGWNIYDTVLSPGNLAGTPGYDVLGRDASGALWLYFGHGDGTVTDRHRIGGGWNTYTQIVGKGDLTGDKWPDIIARDASGVLWLYQGTGDTADPFTTRTKIGAGWNAYDYLVTPGDIDIDGKADLIARQPNGDLYFYKGTGITAAPFEAKRNIGSGYRTYRVLFS
ncbi:FG-GAP repeat domain-containing protein [Streptomyces lydicus]|uniref:FG-GAP repeat domain-containing protein n=1 Tax=Streptomyces lydicus TaxID=47763 RepID=UPI0036855A66